MVTLRHKIICDTSAPITPINPLTPTLLCTMFTFNCEHMLSGAQTDPHTPTL